MQHERRTPWCEAPNPGSAPLRQAAGLDDISCIPSQLWDLTGVSDGEGGSTPGEGREGVLTHPPAG